MIVTELHLLNFILIIFLLTTPIIIVDAAASRCYLCSQNTLAECAGSTQSDSSLFISVLQYYTEPCNGQCVLFRNEKSSTIRGCSWTYGHMKAKSTGWHELSPGMQAYFCDSYLCNNGTYEQPEMTMVRAGIIHDDVILTPQQTLSPQQLFILTGNTFPVIHTDEHLPPMNDKRRQLRQCYSCTARLTGCGEYLDPRFAAAYIQPCASSCIIFRNPIDHNLITRDCSTSWPQVHAKSGLHKLLGSDAFFCQESLCNGISFDFIMGIFHNQLPAVITFAPIRPTADTSTTTLSPTSTMTTTSWAQSVSTTMNIEDDDVIWEDPDLDFVIVEPTTTTTMIPIAGTSSPVPTKVPDETDIEYESSTIPPDSIEHFDFIENIPASSTITGGMVVAEQDSQLNWWDLDEVSFPILTESTTTIVTNTFSSSTTKLPNQEDEWAIFNTSTIPSITHVIGLNPEIDLDMNDYFLFPTLSTTPTIDLLNNHTPPFVPYYFTDYKTKDQLWNFDKSVPTLAMPPFSWMLNLAQQNRSEVKGHQSLINKTVTTTNTKKNKKKSIDLEKTLTDNHDHFYEYCHKKQCQHGGRLNSDCLCLCLPAFSGHHCERINCTQEPAHICDFVLEHECKSDDIRYLCPQFCQLNICSSNKSS